MRRVLPLALACLALATAGCLPIPRLDSEPDYHCISEFDLDSTAEPLGSSEEFVRVAGEYAAGDVIPTLDVIALQAGWRPDGWDRLIMIGHHNDDPAVNEVAGTRGICFRGLRGEDANNDFYEVEGTVYGWYIFFDGTHARQTIRWDRQGVIDTDDSSILTRGAPLHPDATVDPPVLRADPPTTP